MELSKNFESNMKFSKTIIENTEKKNIVTSLFKNSNYSENKKDDQLKQSIPIYHKQNFQKSKS